MKKFIGLSNDAVIAVLLIIVYFIAGKFGLSLAFLHESASPIWPPTGVALAACLIFGYRIWPAILIGAFLVNFTTTYDLPTSIAIGIGNMLEGLVGAYLINRFANGTGVFNRATDIAKFIIIVALFATTISATIGVSSLGFFGILNWMNYWDVWITWWLGDFGGAMIITPLIIFIYLDRNLELKSHKIFEAIFSILILILVALISFAGITNFLPKDYPLAFLVIPILIWISYRMPQALTAIANLILSLIVIYGTFQGFGPFALETKNESLLILIFYIIMASTMSLLISASTLERERAYMLMKEAFNRYKERYNPNLKNARKKRK